MSRYVSLCHACNFLLGLDASRCSSASLTRRDVIGRVQVVYGGDWPVLLGSASLKDFTVALKQMVFF